MNKLDRLLKIHAKLEDSERNGLTWKNLQQRDSLKSEIQTLIEDGENWRSIKKMLRQREPQLRKYGVK